MRVRWRRIFNPISRKPVRMKLTGERYPNARHEKAISAMRIRVIGPIRSMGGMGLMELLFRFGQFCQYAEVFERSCIASDSRAAGDFFQQPPHDFATARLRKRFGETDFVWFCDCTDMHADMFSQFRFQSASSINARFQCHKCDDTLTL